jgi:hypothetical protein
VPVSRIEAWGVLRRRSASFAARRAPGCSFIVLARIRALQLQNNPYPGWCQHNSVDRRRVWQGPPLRSIGGSRSGARSPPALPTDAGGIGQPGGAVADRVATLWAIHKPRVEVRAGGCGFLKSRRCLSLTVEVILSISSRWDREVRFFGTVLPGGGREVRNVSNFTRFDAF